MLSLLKSSFLRLGALALGLVVSMDVARGAEAHHLPGSELLGRWDLTVAGPTGPYPSWLEVKLSGNRTFVGSYVGQFGSARPVSKIQVDGARFKFIVPPQWEHREIDVTVEGILSEDRLTGTVTDDTGKPLTWTGRRAPALHRVKPPEWGTSIQLFNGKNLSGWRAMDPKLPNGWEVHDGVLINARPGNNLISERKFDDFKLHVEFRYPAKSNSGIYLRGRYEAQIEDNFGREPESHLIGGIYGFLTPSVNAAKRPGEWQTYDITLVGRVVSVTLNGQRVIDRQAIPGITGGAVDSDEAAPGPLYLQGDHGQVEFRKVTLTPSR